MDPRRGPYTTEQAAQFAAAVRASVQALSDRLDAEYLATAAARNDKIAKENAHEQNARKR